MPRPFAIQDGRRTLLFVPGRRWKIRCFLSFAANKRVVKHRLHVVLQPGVEVNEQIPARQDAAKAYMGSKEHAVCSHVALWTWGFRLPAVRGAATMATRDIAVIGRLLDDEGTGT
jgi:hypothetical protein